MLNFIIHWFYSTNDKDIGTLYFIFGTFSGILCTLISVLIRLKPAFSGNPYLNLQMVPTLISQQPELGSQIMKINNDNNNHIAKNENDIEKPASLNIKRFPSQSPIEILFFTL